MPSAYLAAGGLRTSRAEHPHPDRRLHDRSPGLHPIRRSGRFGIEAPPSVLIPDGLRRRKSSVSGARLSGLRIYSMEGCSVLGHLGNTSAEVGDAPFPDEEHRVALRQFAMLTPLSPEDEGAIRNRSRCFVASSPPYSRGVRRNLAAYVRVATSIPFTPSSVRMRPTSQARSKPPYLLSMPAPRTLRSFRRRFVSRLQRRSEALG